MIASDTTFQSLGVCSPRPFVLWLGLAMACLAVPRAAPAAEPAVLDLPGGGTLPGTLLPAAADGDGPRGTLVWQSTLFAKPFEFHLDEIGGLRFVGVVAAAATAAPFRCQLRGGDVIDGDLESIDAKQVVIVPSGKAGPVAIERGIVQGITRRGAGTAGTYVGPAGLAGWQQAPEATWTEEAGRIAAQRRGASVSRDVGAPARARYDMIVSWRQPPEFRVAVAAADTARDDSYRLEVLGMAAAGASAALVRQEAEKAGLKPLEIERPAQGRLRIVMFVDQEKGRLAVVLAAEGAAPRSAEVTVPPPARPASARFRLSLSSGDLCLESLRVTPWKTAEPRLDEDEGTAIVGRDGRRIGAEIESFDKAAGQLVLRPNAGGPERLPIDSVDEITFALAPVPGDAGPGPAIRVLRASGGTLSGDLHHIDEEAVWLSREGLDAPVAVPRSDILAITSLRAAQPPRGLPGRSGEFRAAGVVLRGCLVDGSPWQAGVAWQPLGSATASPLAVGAAGAVTVEYVPRSPKGEPGAGMQIEVGGIGGVVNQDGAGFFVVTMLADDGAAARDGTLQPGDRLLAVRPREQGAYVETKGLDADTVMNLLRGRVGTKVALRVTDGGGDNPREIILERGAIYVAGRDVLERALQTHARLAAVRVAVPDGGRQFPALAILRSGDVVSCAVEAMDGRGMRLRTPVADAGAETAVTVAATLVRAVELDPAAASRGIDKVRQERLLTVPRSQRDAPPTHLLRLRDGDYLRGRLESLDAETVTIDVRGERKRLPRADVVRVIWLHSDDAVPQAAAADQPQGEGLLVQGVAASGRVTLVAERMEGNLIRGRSPAFGTGRIDVDGLERLLIGKAIAADAEELPYSRWRLKPAPEPKAAASGGAGQPAASGGDGQSASPGGE